MRPRFIAVSGVGSGYGPAPLSRLRRALIVLCAALVVASAVSLGVVATSSSARRGAPPAPAQRPGSGPGAPSLTAVQVLLDRHAADVLMRNRAAFTADLDTSAAAAPYRATQEAAFDNLAAVPLAAWSYRLSAPVTGGSVLDDAAARYHAPVLIARVTQSYQLQGVDPAPTAHDLWLTFVRRSGHVLIAGDADLAGEGGASWHGPWDFGPVAVRRGASSLVLAHPADADDLATLTAAADEAVRAVTGVIGPGWSQHVVLVLGESQDEMRAFVGGANTGDSAAETVGDESDPNTGLRVVLNPAEITRLTPLGLRIVLRHEITHVATWTLATQAMPTWLIEGFADYVGNLGSRQPVGVTAGELRGEIRNATLPATLPTSQDFSSGEHLPQIYEEAWFACRLIAALAGQPGLVRFYRLVARSTQPPDRAVAAALRDVVALSTSQFTARWRRYMQAELR